MNRIRTRYVVQPNMVWRTWKSKKQKLKKSVEEKVVCIAVGTEAEVKFLITLAANQVGKPVVRIENPEAVMREMEICNKDAEETVNTCITLVEEFMKGQFRQEDEEDISDASSDEWYCNNPDCDMYGLVTEPIMDLCSEPLCPNCGYELYPYFLEDDEMTLEEDTDAELGVIAAESDEEEIVDEIDPFRLYKIVLNLMERLIFVDRAAVHKTAHEYFDEYCDISKGEYDLLQDIHDAMKGGYL